MNEIKGHIPSQQHCVMIIALTLLTRKWMREMERAQQQMYSLCDGTIYKYNGYKKYT